MASSDATTAQVRRALSGDPESLGWLVERFSPGLLAQARYRMGPVLARRLDPDDVVQDAWVIAIPRFGELAITDRRATPTVLRFLSSIVLYRTNQLLRAHLRRATPQGPESPDALPTSDDGALTQTIRRETVRLVLAQVDALDPADREVLVLRGLEQRAGKEVADLLGVSVDVVYVRYHRAIRRLRSVLPDSLFADPAFSADAGRDEDPDEDAQPPN